MISETEVDGATYVQTIYNGTLTLEVTHPNGTTTVQVEDTDETTEFVCGYFSRYRCADPSSGCADDDDYKSTAPDDYFWGSDDFFNSTCSAETDSCFDSEECIACLMSGSSSSSSEDVFGTCPLWTNTCSAYADFYCCAIPAMMDEGCNDIPELVGYLGKSSCFDRSSGLGMYESTKASWAFIRGFLYDKIRSKVQCTTVPSAARG